MPSTRQGPCEKLLWFEIVLRQASVLLEQSELHNMKHFLENAVVLYSKLTHDFQKIRLNIGTEVNCTSVWAYLGTQILTAFRSWATAICSESSLGAVVPQQARYLIHQSH